VLANQMIDLGPFNVPVWLLGAIGGYIVSLILPRLFFRDRKSAFSLAHDALSTGVLLGFFTWKLVPILTRFDEIRESFSRLIYYPGGPVGLAAGIIVGLVVVVLMVRRKLRQSRDADESSDSVSPVWVGAALSVIVACIAAPVFFLSLFPSYAREVDPSVSVRELLESPEPRPAVVVYWATWCGPCSAQMPEIQRFYDDHRESVGLFAINLTSTEPGRQHVEGYLADFGYTLPVVYDERDRLRSDMNVRATPTTIVFDTSGTERHRRTGAVTAAWIERRVLPLRQ